ncbi:MAG: sugar ABC transporter permease [Pyrinomonadaceae bacterium]|nr:sugar ABC transporter permease [Acidobacteriota bacterium]MBP7474452.1 sugar ABC transporter permease [Pyrinomonadaceae bacterium]MBP9108469.1 sugar ABC transporter permease [Pyrinomonadaceae bacterium]
MFRQEHRTGLMLAMPLLVSTTILVLIPTLVTFIFAFTNFDGLSQIKWVGFSNFSKIWGDTLFWTSLKNSFYIAAVGVPLRITIALFLALLLTPERTGVGAARSSAFLPTVIPDISYALLWLWMLNPIYGPVAYLISALGLPGDQLLLTPFGARFSIVFMSLFQIGEIYIVLLAARRELPHELYELCTIEGTSAFWTFKRLTLPLLMPTIVFLTARDVAWSLQSTFVPSLVITKGGPNFATLFLPLYIYQNGFEYMRLGLASAMTTVMFLLTGLMIFVQVRVLRFRKGLFDL